MSTTHHEAFSSSDPAMESPEPGVEEHYPDEWQYYKVFGILVLITAAEVARDAGAIVVGAPVLPAAGNGDSAADDTRLRQERKDAGITAILHESASVRFWDHDLGPDQPRLFAVDPDQVQETEIGWAGGDKEARVADGTEVNQNLQDAERAAAYARLRDLTPEPGRALDGQAFELTPDGTSVVTGWWQWDPADESHSELVMIDVASGKRRVLLSGPEFDFQSPRVAPDGPTPLPREYAGPMEQGDASAYADRTVAAFADVPVANPSTGPTS